MVNLSIIPERIVHVAQSTPPLTSLGSCPLINGKNTMSQQPISVKPIFSIRTVSPCSMRKSVTYYMNTKECQ